MGSWPIARTHTTDCCADTIPTGARFHNFGYHKMVDNRHCRNLTQTSLVSIKISSIQQQISRIIKKLRDENSTSLCINQLQMKLMLFGYSISRPVWAIHSMNFVRKIFGKLSSIMRDVGMATSLLWLVYNALASVSFSIRWCAGALDFCLC